MALEAAEDHSAIHGQSGVLIGVYGDYGGTLLSQPPRAHGFCATSATPVYEDNTARNEWGNSVIGGRERAKHIDIQKHFAHEVIQNGHMKLIRVSTTSQLADIDPAAALPAVPGVRRRDLGSGGDNHLRDLRPPEGVLLQGYQVESRQPLRGVCRRLG